MFKSLHRFWLLTFLAMTGLGPAAAFAAPSPSFSCSQHMSPDEQAICKNPQLTALDHIANQGYLFLREKLGKAQANKINLPLIRQRQKCKADVVCIEKAQRESIRVFNQNGAGLEIPDPAPEAAVKNEPAVALNPPVAKTEAPAPVEAPATPEATTPVSRAATTPTLKEPPALKESPAPKEPPATETPPVTTTAEAEAPAAKSAEGTEEVLDQPPVESESNSAANDNSASQNKAPALADARPKDSGDREWRSDVEKEIRAESELESEATDVLEKEMEEQAKPISRQEKQALQKHKNKHRIAFILAGILFALLVGYAISKLRRDPGVIAPAAKQTPPQAGATTTTAAPASPSSAPRPAALLLTTAEPQPTARSSAKPTPDAPASPTPVKPLPPKAWVWSQYKGRV
jgi:uncharacterized protein